MTARRTIVSTQVGADVVVVGTATFHEIGPRITTTFRYDTDYLFDTPSAYAIDPQIPLADGDFNSRGIPAAFLDTSPDQWGRRLLESKNEIGRRTGGSRSPALTEVDLLLGVSDFMRQGALRFQDDEDGKYLTDHKSVPKEIELEHLLADVDEFLSEEPTNWVGATQNLLEAGGDTLGGMRAKAAVTDGSDIWLAKFPMPTDQLNVMAWEKTSLDLAERAGIEVPDRRLVNIGGRHVLLIKRFDRDAERRIPYISGRTLMQMSGDDIRNFDYSSMAQALRIEGDQPQADLERLWRRVAFMVIINNTDNHLLNHGFLHEGSGWKISPAFDLNPNRNLGQPRSGAVGGAYYPDGSIDGLMRLAADCKMRPSRADEVLREVVDATAGWKEAASGNGATGWEIDKFTEAFSVLSDEARVHLGLPQSTTPEYIFTAKTDPDSSSARTQPRNKDTGTTGNPGKYDTFKKKTSNKSPDSHGSDLD